MCKDKLESSTQYLWEIIWMCWSQVLAKRTQMQGLFGQIILLLKVHISTTLRSLL
jgi:hypothetical protein